MLPGQPSQSMVQTALLRAAHQLFDKPLIFADPLAVGFVPETGEAALLAQTDRLHSPIFTRRRASIALRSRFAEDRLAIAARRGVRQYVVLAAGLDTFAWRQPAWAREMTIFVLDMPASLDWVRSRLRERRLPEPDNVTFVPIDLEHEDMGERLVAAGFVSQAPMFCSALGIVQYLSAPAVDAMLRFAASCVQDSEIVFSFGVSSDNNSENGRHVQAEAMQRTGSYGEPWLTLLDPSAVSEKLEQLGFRETFLLTPEIASRRYLNDRDDGLHISGSEVSAAAIR